MQMRKKRDWYLSERHNGDHLIIKRMSLLTLKHKHIARNNRCPVSKTKCLQFSLVSKFNSVNILNHINMASSKMNTITATDKLVCLFNPFGFLDS